MALAQVVWDWLLPRPSVETEGPRLLELADNVAGGAPRRSEWLRLIAQVQLNL
jgi:hypothetical protein